MKLLTLIDLDGESKFAVHLGGKEIWRGHYDELEGLLRVLGFSTEWAERDVHP